MSDLRMRDVHGAQSSLRAAAVALTLVLLTACTAGQGGKAPDGTSAPAASSGTLTIAVVADPVALWPGFTPTQSTINVVEQIHEKLIEFDPDGRGYTPRLATSWQQIDATTVRFKLRENVKFTNGEPFNAETVKFSLEVMMEQPQWKSVIAQPLAGASVVDAHTVDIKAKNPTALAMTSIARIGFQLPPAYFKSVGADGFAQKPIGTGPYKFDAWNKGVSVTLTRNDEYWNGKPSFEKVVWRVIPEVSSQIAALRSGAADIAPLIPSNYWAAVEGGGVKLVTAKSNVVYVVAFNTLVDSPVKNPLVRQAMQYAVDREALIKGPLEGHAYAMTDQPATAGYVGFVPDRRGYTYDPAKAKALLIQAGYPNGFETEVVTSVNESKDIVVAMASQMAKVGITLKISIVDFGTFIKKLTSPPTGISGMYYANSLTAPHAWYQYAAYRSGGHYSFYANSKYQALLDRALAEPDEAAQVRTFGQMLDVLAEDPAYIPLFQGADGYAVRDRLDGFKPWHTLFLDVRAWRFK